MRKFFWSWYESLGNSESEVTPQSSGPSAVWGDLANNGYTELIYSLYFTFNYATILQVLEFSKLPTWQFGALIVTALYAAALGGGALPLSCMRTSASLTPRPEAPWTVGDATFPGRTQWQVVRSQVFPGFGTSGSVRSICSGRRGGIGYLHMLLKFRR